MPASGLADPGRPGVELQGQAPGAVLPRGSSARSPCRTTCRAVSKPLQLTPTVIANIFQGKITKWNDPAIARLNSGVKLPSTAITIARRFGLLGNDGCTSPWFLMDFSQSAWSWAAARPSTGRPAARGWQRQRRGGADRQASTPGAIGYVDYADAKASGLSFADVQNSSGKFVAPSTAAASAAAAGAKVAPNLTFAAVWSGGPTAYPITYQSWDLVYAKQPNANTAKMLKAYIGYLLGPGQQLLPSLATRRCPPTWTDRPRRSSARSLPDCGEHHGAR